MDVFQVGVTTHGKGTKQVERSRGLAIGHDLALRIGHACLLRELDPVDDVAAVARQRYVTLLLDTRGARLGELAGNTADLDDRLLRPEGQDDGHLQEGAEEVPDRIGAVFGKALGAIAPLQQKTTAVGDIGKRTLQTARLSCKDKRRIFGKTRFHAVERCEVRIIRHLLNGFLPPAVRSPSLCHFHHLLSDADRPASRPCDCPAARHPDLHASAPPAPPIPAKCHHTQLGHCRGCGLINVNRKLGKPSYQKTWTATAPAERP